jgi:hypothetical protein
LGGQIWQSALCHDWSVNRYERIPLYLKSAHQLKSFCGALARTPWCKIIYWTSVKAYQLVTKEDWAKDRTATDTLIKVQNSPG